MRSYHPPRVSLYANKLLHATGERDMERLELADRNAAPSLVTRSFIAIERTSRNTPPFLRRGDKSHREDRTRKGTARRGNEAQHEGDRRPRGDARPAIGLGAGGVGMRGYELGHHQSLGDTSLKPSHARARVSRGAEWSEIFA